MRTLYTCLFYLATPFILLRLLWRSIKAPSYRSRWRERFGLYNRKYRQDVIWFHAVSVGEAEALFPLAKLVLQHHPDANLLITTTTPTGSARVKAVMQNSVGHVYLPYDIPFAITRFMQCFKPKMAVVMETEIWPNLFAYCGKHKMPLYIINARLSEKSAKGYQKLPALVCSTLAHVKLIAAQTQDDALRFAAIGAKSDAVKVLGNIKFDGSVSNETIIQGRQLKIGLFDGRFVWLVASTHKDEEAIFLEVYKQLKQEIPNILLVIVPRHPERFAEVKKLAGHHQLTVASRSVNDPCHQHTDVYLADTMGELKMMYAASDVAFVGGSMVPVGGHNILEAAVVGTPILFGPYMANFKDIAEGMLRLGGAIQCHDKSEIFNAMIALYSDPTYRQSLIGNGKEFVRLNKGALTNVFDILSQDF